LFVLFAFIFISFYKNKNPLSPSLYAFSLASAPAALPELKSPRLAAKEEACDAKASSEVFIREEEEKEEEESCGWGAGAEEVANGTLEGDALAAAVGLTAGIVPMPLGESASSRATLLAGAGRGGEEAEAAEGGGGAEEAAALAAAWRSRLSSTRGVASSPPSPSPPAAASLARFSAPNARAREGPPAAAAARAAAARAACVALNLRKKKKKKIGFFLFPQ